MPPSICSKQSKLSRLVEAVESGAEAEIVIARNGRPAARLVPIRADAVGNASASPRASSKSPIPSTPTRRRSRRCSPARRVRLLLDTHIALWAIADTPAFGEGAPADRGSENEIVVSADSYGRFPSSTRWPAAARTTCRSPAPRRRLFQGGRIELLSISPQDRLRSRRLNRSMPIRSTACWWPRRYRCRCGCSPPMQRDAAYSDLVSWSDPAGASAVWTSRK